MVYRIFTEKKRELAAEARALLNDINTLLQIKSATSLRVINRYDAENITKELFDYGGFRGRISSRSVRPARRLRRAVYSAYIKG